MELLSVLSGQRLLAHRNRLQLADTFSSFAAEEGET
jgi:hypothetical protein